MKLRAETELANPNSPKNTHEGEEQNDREDDLDDREDMDDFVADQKEEESKDA